MENGKCWNGEREFCNALITLFMDNFYNKKKAITLHCVVCSYINFEKAVVGIILGGCVFIE